MYVPIKAVAVFDNKKINGLVRFTESNDLQKVIIDINIYYLCFLPYLQCCF